MYVERIAPSGRAAWLALRKHDVTASQIGALFGAHEYLSPYQLWALKSGRFSDEIDETPVIRRGRMVEPVAVDMLREQFPKWKIDHNAKANIYFRAPEHRIGATPDVIVQAPGRGLGVVQIKSVAERTYRQKWIDDEGQPEAPLWIALQAIQEAYLVGAAWAAVAPLVIGYGIDMPLIEIPLDPGVFEAIKKQVQAFWILVNSGREPAPDYAMDGELIGSMYGDGDPNHEIDLTGDNRIPELLAAREAALEALRRAKKVLGTVDAEIKSKMGAAHVGHLGQGRVITWKPERRAGHFVPQSTIRALRYPKDSANG